MFAFVQFFTVYHWAKLSEYVYIPLGECRKLTGLTFEQ